ncbi:hypothetical protein ACFE04_012115 [Oxalis oulophora]
MSKFQIFVRTLSGDITAFVGPQDTIVDLGWQVASKLSIPPVYHRFFFNGTLLQLYHDFAYYNVQKNSTITLVLEPWTSFAELENEIAKHEELTFAILANIYTVGEVKKVMREKMNIPVLELICDGVMLDDRYSFDEYQLTRDSKVTIMYEFFSMTKPVRPPVW